MRILTWDFFKIFEGESSPSYALGLVTSGEIIIIALSAADIEATSSPEATCAECLLQRRRSVIFYHHSNYLVSPNSSFL